VKYTLPADRVDMVTAKNILELSDVSALCITGLVSTLDVNYRENIFW